MGECKDLIVVVVVPLPCCCHCCHCGGVVVCPATLVGAVVVGWCCPTATAVVVVNKKWRKNMEAHLGHCHPPHHHPTHCHPPHCHPTCCNCHAHCCCYVVVVVGGGGGGGGGGGDGCGVMWQVISDLVMVWFACDKSTYHIHIIGPHNWWPVNQVVMQLLACVHEVECSILIVVFLFSRDRNYILIKFSDSYSTDSMRIGQGWSPDSPHGQVHVDWIKGGLEVDWKIVNLAGDSTFSPLAVLAQSLWSPHSVLIFEGDSMRICG